MAEPDDELERVAGDLADTLDALRQELEADRRGPPRVVDLLRFTERYTIPAVIAVLEANIRILELLAGGIRVATGDEAPAERRGATADAARATLDALDSALQDATRALSGGTPANPEARELLQEARSLRAELDDRLERETGTRPPSDSQSQDDTSKDPVSIDVDSELQGIREDVEAERQARERLDDRLDGDDEQ